MVCIQIDVFDLKYIISLTKVMKDQWGTVCFTRHSKCKVGWVFPMVTEVPFKLDLYISVHSHHKQCRRRYSSVDSNILLYFSTRNLLSTCPNQLSYMYSPSNCIFLNFFGTKIGIYNIFDNGHQKILIFWKFREFLENASIFGGRLYVNTNKY